MPVAFLVSGVIRDQSLPPETTSPGACYSRTHLNDNVLSNRLRRDLSHVLTGFYHNSTGMFVCLRTNE